MIFSSASGWRESVGVRASRLSQRTRENLAAGAGPSPSPSPGYAGRGQTVAVIPRRRSCEARLPDLIFISLSRLRERVGVRASRLRQRARENLAAGAGPSPSPSPGCAGRGQTVAMIPAPPILRALATLSDLHLPLPFGGRGSG